MFKKRTLSLKAKFLYGVAGVVLALSAMNFLTFSFLRGQISELSQMIDAALLTNELVALSGQVTEGLPAEVAAYAIHPNAEAKEHIQAIYRKAKVQLDQLGGMVVDDESRVQLSLVKNMFASSSETFEEIIQSLDGKQVPFSEINRLVASVGENSSLLNSAIQGLLGAELRRDQVAKAALAKKADRSGIGILIFIVVIGVSSFFLFFNNLVKKNILLRLDEMQTTMSRIATDTSDLGLRVDASRDDEIGRLALHFNSMADALQKYKESLEYQLKKTQDLNVQLSEVAAAAKKANEAKSVFLANMSHELRTPMHGILSFAGFGQKKIDTADKEKLKSYFDEIHESGSRLMSLLNDLLDLSKLEAGKIDYAFKEADLVATVKFVASEMAAFAEEKGLKLDVPGDAPSLMGVFDSDHVARVVRNLLSNAIKFSHKGTVVKIGLSQETSTFRCTVSNSGIGIPEAELSSIFEKFTQSSKTKTGAGGTGLGLAICREIIEQHGGKIWAISPPNGETQFIFEIPKVAPIAAHG